uniref:endothelial cell-specific molecule 1 isoform X1 n=1 Tax=Myxine glutinosa TaxID=7769 RepID=UPI00358E53D7
MGLCGGILATPSHYSSFCQCPRTSSLSPHYAVDCPVCATDQCLTLPKGCRRIVRDDCGCCDLCAAPRGGPCYPTVVAMHGWKCATGLRCVPAGNDEFGDSIGVCRDCPAGTYGDGCLGVCNCLAGSCDQETGKCRRGLAHAWWWNASRQRSTHYPKAGQWYRAGRR